MPLNQQLQTRQGDIGLTVYQDKKTGQVLFSFDKFHEARLQKTSGLFTEKELAAFNTFIQDHFESRHALYGKERSPEYNVEAQTGFEKEVKDAICRAKERLEPEKHIPPDNPKECVPHQPPKPTAIITVLPVFPKYRYVHTCSKCGCHVASTATIGCSQIRICAYCLLALPAPA